MTAKILHIDSSARTDGSVTRQLTNQIVSSLNGTVIRRDLADGVPLLNGAWLAANFTAQEDRTPEQTDVLSLSESLISEIMDADTLVIGAPIYNFGVPAALKAWIDLVCRAGLTFRYSEAGPVGLLTGKRAVIVIASGGTEVGSAIDYASGYLRHVLGFIGITDVQIVSADRVMVQGDAAIAAAQTQIEALTL